MNWKFTLFAVLVMVSVSAYAVVSECSDGSEAASDDSGSCGDNVTYVFDSSTGTLTISGSGGIYSSGGAPWYPYRSDVKKVIIEDGVTSIGQSAFSGCYSLASVTIPDSVTSIRDWAFGGCISLASITIPDGVTSIGGYAFSECTSLASITIPDGVTSIGQSAFDGCTSLASVTIPDSVTFIGSSAFYGCTPLASVTIPDSVTFIGDQVFQGCTFLASVTIPDGVTSIGWYAFSECTSLASITIPDSVTSIGFEAFYRCTSLASVTIPDSVTSIGGFAFHDCTRLASVTIGKSVTSIGTGAFNNCRSLTMIAIPDSVTSIGDCAFNECTRLASVTIGKSVTSIGREAFSGCTSLASVTIPDSVTSIRNEAFYRCNSLTTVNVACTSTLNITKGSYGNGYVAYYAETVNLIHAYFAIYEWADDGSSCTVHVVCAKDAAHNHDINAQATSSVKIPPTCVMGITTYSISGNYEGFAYASSKDVVDIPALNNSHAYSATYVWADDGSSCTVHIVCANDASHNHDIFAEVTSVVHIQPTTTALGTTKYSVSGTYDGFAYASEKSVKDIPALEPEIRQKEEGSTRTYANTVTENTATQVTEIFNTAKTNGGSVEMSVSTDVTTAPVTIAFDNAAVTAVGGNDVTITANLVTDSTEVPGAVMVLEVTLNGATFSEGKATITIPFSGSVPEGKIVKVYFINGDQRQDMNATLKDGNLVFETDHFSTYAVMFEDAPSGFPIMLIVIAVVIVIAAIGGVFVMKRRTA
ncbi:leucine-rich repeat domain-containing protein [Methanomethylophilus alvi]|uniref:leucine-rich repeat domain-containing protein n=1 Tax=Methanomethylophilus alvi TaxID=1291540 RepID=UPI0037DDD0BC